MNAYCQNTIGSFKCQCSTGFSRDGTGICAGKRSSLYAGLVIFDNYGMKNRLTLASVESAVKSITKT